MQYEYVTDTAVGLPINVAVVVGIGAHREEGAIAITNLELENMTSCAAFQRNIGHRRSQLK